MDTEKWLVEIPNQISQALFDGFTPYSLPSAVVLNGPTQTNKIRLCLYLFTINIVYLFVCWHGWLVFQWSSSTDWVVRLWSILLRLSFSAIDQTVHVSLFPTEMNHSCPFSPVFLPHYTSCLKDLFKPANEWVWWRAAFTSFRCSSLCLASLCLASLFCPQITVMLDWALTINSIS